MVSKQRKGYAAALKQGAVIGPHQRFQHIGDTYGELMAGYFWWTHGSCTMDGRWVSVQNRYLGLKFRISGQSTDGWARLSVNLKGSKITATLTGYAYETSPNKAIQAGKTHGPVDDTTARQGSIKQETSAARVITQVPPVGQSGSLGRLAQGNAAAFWTQ